VPKITIPTLVGKPKFDKVLPTTNLNSQIYVGPRVPPRDQENQRGLLNLTSPIDRGVVENVEEYAHILEYIYGELKVQKKDVRSAHQTLVMLTEPINNPKASRANLAQIMFEKFKAPGIIVAQQPVLSL